MASWENLSQELMIKILSQLPPECVARLKCVSKYMYVLINDPNFADYLQHRNLLVKRTIANEESGENETMLSFLKFPLPSAVVDMDFPLPEVFEFCGLSGYSHGLICLSLSPNDIFLCNPATGELRELPPSILLTKPSDDPFDRTGTSMDAVGFGYDQKSRDFKAVRVVEVREEYAYPYYKTEVYDLAKDGWREIESRACGSVFWAPSFEMYHEGRFYWRAIEDGGSEIIQWFDMSEEVFGRIPMPECFAWGSAEHRSLVVWTGQIVLFYYDPNKVETTFQIWAMGKDNSWSKVFTIGPISGIERPLVFVSSQELVMEAKDGQLILYNLNTQCFLQLPVKGLPEKFQATVFVKTLLPVNSNNFKL
ncbi:F-box/kelch-repeat protein At3g06240-like [Momordica charantia]|uniref:F-box/kelch-repeat protein At3g06240-like n=1 Tax=Momordica charantia TaxID=3673 RepID=A0A6J1E295_MOMCH|nr:F-box/kelch-repeat protein At3g06240-like [Momordica charantia]